jgi:Holliday junction resolvasome RuvABC ATP-dependent DNA helicase subunit
MRVLFERGGENVSLQSLALALSADAKQIQFDVEPWLCQQRWIGIAPGGRHLTEQGAALVKINMEENSK